MHPEDGLPTDLTRTASKPHLHDFGSASEERIRVGDFLYEIYGSEPERALSHPRARTCKTYAQFKYTVTYLLRVTIANLMQERGFLPPRPRWDAQKPAPTAPRAAAVAPSRYIPAGGPPFRFSDPRLFGFSRPKPRTPPRATLGARLLFARRQSNGVKRR